MGRYLGRGMRVVAVTLVVTAALAVHGATAIAEPLSDDVPVTVPVATPSTDDLQPPGTQLGAMANALATLAGPAPSTTASQGAVPTTSVPEPRVTAHGAVPVLDDAPRAVANARPRAAPRAGSRGLRPLLGGGYTAFLEDEGMRALTVALLGALATAGVLAFGWGGVLTARDRRRLRAAQTEWAARGSNPEPPG